MRTMTIFGWLSVTGLSWATAQKVDFVLPQQERSRAIHVETHKEKLEIEGHEVDFKVRKGAAACYRVSERLFAVQARNLDHGALFLWDSREKKVTDKMFDLHGPMLWPVAPKRRLIQMHGKEAGYYGVNPSTNKFVRIGTIESDQVGITNLLGGNRDRLFFLKELNKPHSWTRSRGFGETTLEVVESGKEPVELKVDLGDFVPIGSDSIRGNRLLLAKLETAENRDTTKPPKYQVACWNFEKERLERLGELEGGWVKSERTPPKGGWGRQGRPEPKLSPYLQIWWLPQDQEVNPIGNHSSYATSWVDPDTMEITKTEPKASR